MSLLRSILLFLFLPFSMLSGHSMAAVARFLDAPLVPVTEYTNAVAVADFNNDGIDDIATAGSANSTDTVSILLGNGDGTFQKAKDFTTGSGPGAIAVADLNGDGKLDIVTSDFGVDDGFSNKVSVLLGNGDGTFQGRVDYTAGNYPNSVAITDFNNDGKLDLVVGNQGAFSVLLGNGNGTFQPPILTPGTNSTLSVVAADFNRDGKQDVAIADQLNNQVGVFPGKGDGTFQNRQSYASGGGAVSLKVVDLNGDSLVDLAVANFLSNSVSVLLGNGDGTFQPHMDTTTAASPHTLTFGDFNGDHKTDLAVVEMDEYLTGASPLAILLGKGDGTFQSSINYGGTGPVAVGNFNGDGAADLAGCSGLGVVLLLGNGNGTFQARTDYPIGSYPSAIATADVSGDGKLDLAIANLYLNNTVSVLLGRGDGSFKRNVDYAAGNAPAGVAIGDVSRDGKKDLVVANSGSNSISVFLGKGDGTFLARVDYATASTPSWIALGDLNGDGNLDAVTANKVSAGSVSVLLGNGDGTFRTHVEYTTGKNPAFLLIDDFNRDGRSDLAVADSAISGGPSPVSILLGNGDGTFQTHVDYPTAADVVFLAVGDINGDTKKDLAASTGPILLGNGDGTFHSGGNFDFTAGGSAIVAGDFNGDGRLDLLPTGGVFSTVTNLLMGKGDGTFRKAQVFQVGNTPVGAATGDFNGDGAIDAAVANSSSRNVSILLNTGGVNVTLQSSENPSHFGDNVTFNATVVPTFISSGTPAGNVIFKDGNTTLGMVALVAGQGSFTTSTLGVGVHKITAQYGGDNNFLGRKSPSLNQTVLQ